MEAPEFPQEFVKNHCLKVLQAREWREHFNLAPDPVDDEAHAECAFVPKGFGLECENCRQFLCSAPPNRPGDAHLPAIRKYYEDSSLYEKYTQSDEYKERCRRKEEEAAVQRNIGAFI